MKKIAILQSNYIPWKGYFDLIAAVDEFIIYDDMQYTRQDWRNRNQIKTPQGVQWLTVPVGISINRRIRDVNIGTEWQSKHWKTLSSNYSRAPYFLEIAEWLEPIYMRSSYTNLSVLNRSLIQSICDYLDIKTTISNSWDYTLIDGKSERLASLCKQAGGTEYISGPSAKNYLDESAFFNVGIKLSWFDYSAYPTYSQLWGEFSHGVTILDLLFNTGKEAKNYMRYVR